MVYPRKRVREVENLIVKYQIVLRDSGLSQEDFNKVTKLAQADNMSISAANRKHFIDILAKKFHIKNFDLKVENYQKVLDYIYANQPVELEAIFLTFPKLKPKHVSFLQKTALIDKVKGLYQLS